MVPKWSILEVSGNVPEARVRGWRASRARPTEATGWFSPQCRESLKSMILVPWQQEVQISRKHIIYYTAAMISWCRDHQNIDVLGPKITNKAAKQLSWCPWRGKGSAKQLSWC